MVALRELVLPEYFESGSPHSLKKRPIIEMGEGRPSSLRRPLMRACLFLLTFALT